MNTYVLLWSKRQNCYHIELLSDLLNKNLDAFKRDASLNDYHLIAIGTRQQVDEIADSGRALIRERDDALRAAA